MKTIVILNKQHSLTKEQKETLLKNFEKFEMLLVPENGWTLNEMKNVVKQLQLGYINKEAKNIIFASPIPALIKLVSEEILMDSLNPSNWFVFHNGKREKRKLPNGKIISVVATKGCELV
ncbi:hypothetical protein K144316041_p21630 (plasmid) [Clostridium tetani]|uniref:hypothetical protein n=1 Tax=Clostridium tetani TaxID=1513 RepID=UPI00295303FC|nr:hypothetical protein [Clostridium tetani]BDR74324.1 hypothetical protein K144316041_p21630 [Clostridium tetani]